MEKTDGTSNDLYQLIWMLHMNNSWTPNYQDIASNPVVQNLVQKPDITEQSIGQSIHYAAYYSDMSLLKLLIKFHPQSVNWKDNQGNLPIHHTTNYGMVKILIDAGSDVDSKNVNGHTPFYNALGASSFKTMKLLIKKGASSEIDPALGFPMKTKNYRKKTYFDYLRDD